jgi:hypothetical protein
MTRQPCVFRLNDWDNPAPGVWEATATHDTHGRPTFEAVATHHPDRPGWTWALYQPLTEDPTDGLGLVADGHAPTLATAQRHADSAARRWRDLQHHPLEVRP